EAGHESLPGERHRPQRRRGTIPGPGTTWKRLSGPACPAIVGHLPVKPSRMAAPAASSAAKKPDLERLMGARCTKKGSYMRIAQIAPLTETVPPKLYGGTERVVSFLTEELVAQGHEVTLFACGGSVTSAKLEAMYPTPLR